MELLQKLYHDVLETHDQLTSDDITFAKQKLIGYPITLLVYLLRNYYVGKFSIILNKQVDESIKHRNNITVDVKWKEIENLNLTYEEKEELIKMRQIQEDAMFNMIEYLKQNKIPDENLFTTGLYHLFLDDVCDEIGYPISNFRVVIKIEENQNIKYLKYKKIKYVDIFESRNPKELKLING